MSPAPKVLWQPLPKQADFLSASEDEVLYGGGVGGGKTDALIIDALGLQQNATGNRRYRALIIRRTFPELADIIDRARFIYPQITKCSYNASNHEFRFESGAKIIFGYASNKEDATRYQGQEYQYIAFEELTQWSTPDVYEYLKSRLRGTNLRKYIRATSNPGGLGGKWVQRYFNIDDSGSPSRLSIKVDLGNGKTKTITRRFIPALLKDNPYLSDDYKAQLMTMSETDKKALIEGRWDCYEVRGSIYKTEIADLKKSRLIKGLFDPNLEVVVAWDIGISDSMALTFAQVSKGEVRIIDYLEVSNMSMKECCQEVKLRYGDNVRMILPHDGNVRDTYDGVTRVSKVRDLGFNVRIVKGRVEDGINAARSVLNRAYFDPSTCSRLLDCLTNYRRQYSVENDVFTNPIHDKYSHGADSFRYLSMSLKEDGVIRTLDLKTLNLMSKTGNVGSNSLNWMI